jgi:Tfp pilus assembly protein PilF
MQTAGGDPPASAADEAAYAAACDEADAGRFEAARDAFLALRARLPRPLAPLELQLGHAYFRLGATREALPHLEAAAALDPTSFHAHALLARLRPEVGDTAGTVASLLAAEAHAPPEPSAWRDLGLRHAELARWDDADRTLTRADALDPGEPATASLLAVARGEQGDDTGARATLERALARDPDDPGIAFAYNLYLPQVYDGVEDMERWRARYSRGLGELAADLGRWRARARHVLDLNRTNFYLAYQGGDDRDLQRRYSRLMGALATTVHPEWAERPARRSRAGRRVRVGFVGGIFRDCTAGRYFERWITGLDPKRFECRVYHTAPFVDDFTRRIAAGCEQFSTLRVDGESAVEHLRREELDVLVQPEVGMTPLSYLLAAVRVAPLQCAGWGHPVTTGGDGVDCFFTCEAMEPADAAAHYTEELVRLPGLGGGLRDAARRGAVRAREAAPARGRPPLRLPAVALQDPPGDGRAVRAPAGRRPRRRAVVLPGDGAQRDRSFRRAPAARARRARDRALGTAQVPAAHERRGLPPRARQRRRGRRHAALVRRQHQPGRHRRGHADRFAAGALHARAPERRDAAPHGLDELVAGSEDEYVATAVAVASDAERNRALRALIAGRRGALFDRPEPLQAFAEALLRMARA